MSTQEGKIIEGTYLSDTLVGGFGDGIMIMRHLMEAFPGQALIDKAIDPTYALVVKVASSTTKLLNQNAELGSSYGG